MRRSGLCLMMALVLAVVTELASAETYPARPIVMIAPFAAGAPVDGAKQTQYACDEHFGL